MAFFIKTVFGQTREMNMKKAPNTNKLKYVGAALLEGESVTLIQAARLVLEIKEALGDEICTITRCREVVSLGLNAIKTSVKPSASVRRPWNACVPKATAVPER